MRRGDHLAGPGVHCEEQRIFLFIDVNDSTKTIATIGHLRYAGLLVHLFDALEGLARQYNGDPYQVVGDEVVLTWTESKENASNAIGLYQAFLDHVHAERGLMGRRFGANVCFKAALHCGDVTRVPSNGMTRTPLYFGEVLHVCARLLPLCKSLGESLLITRQIASLISGAGFRLGRSHFLEIGAAGTFVESCGVSCRVLAPCD